MKKNIAVVCLGTCCLASAGEVLANERTDDPLGIAISPQALILGAEQSGRVTVHTDIAGSTVDRSTVALEGIPASSTWVDLRGNLVAGFPEADVKAFVAPPEATLTLTGNRLDGTPFEGSDTVTVLDSTEPHASSILAESTGFIICDPNCSEPNICDPNWSGPNRCDPNRADPNTCDPDWSGPNRSDPTRSGLNYCDPNCCDPNCSGPNSCEPNSSGPNTVDPDVVDPLMATNRCGDTAVLPLALTLGMLGLVSAMRRRA